METYFQYFAGDIKKSYPLGNITLNQFIEANRNPKENIKILLNEIAEATKNKDIETKTRLKTKLYSFSPCVVLNGRRKYDNIVSFTGLAVLDFDKIENALEFKQFLFYEYDFIICCWISPSKKGVKALVSIPIVNSVDEFKSYYFGLAQIMYDYAGFDETGQNCVLPLFISNDNEMLIRDNYTTFTKKGIKYNSILSDQKPITERIETNIQSEKSIITIINKNINKIVDNGHPQVRSLSYAVGGYIAYGYIDKQTALSHLFYCIENNSYLKKGTNGYKITAEYMLNNGMNNPLKIEDNG